MSPATSRAFDWGKLLEDFGVQDSGGSAGAVTVAALSNQEVVDALKEALAQGAEDAIASLGRLDGYYANSRVRIPLPQELATVESALRAIHQDRYADEFVLTMNRAAEIAVSESAQIVGDAVAALTVADAKRILTGPDDAATRYFRRVGEDRLQARLLPVVRQATARSGVTNAYKQLVKEAGFAARYLGMDTVDIDGYVTDKTLEGLFAMIAVEEKRIRDDPVARSTELLKKVFGAKDG
jgi:lysozyme family protein